MRVDKWLWAARFFKTRGVAQQAIAAGRVKIAGERIKPSHALKVGEALVVRIGEYEWYVQVKGLAERRGPALEARKLYEETEASRAERQRRLDMRRWAADPAATIKGRPTKRDRRRLEGWTTLPDES
ncbi:MAG TPA: RNA-binding S4 domain-containing protein [Burkholderiales bacterium]